MCSESMPKEFEKSTDVLPFTKYGLSSLQEFKKVEQNICHKAWLKKVGLSSEEIQLYQDYESGLLDKHKIETSILRKKLLVIYEKISQAENEVESMSNPETPSSSNSTNILQNMQKEPLKFYPEGHPMNEIKDIEESLFSHFNHNDMLPITKRRKILRRLERKKERIQSQKSIVNIETSALPKPGSLWDVKEMPLKQQVPNLREKIIGPKKQILYTIKDDKIVRLEPNEEKGNEYRAVDIVMPVNAAEAQLLEGTKMSVDDIKKIERFKDYEPGIPSKVLYLKNIAPSVSQEQLSLLFNQFMLANEGPVEVRLMNGRMRGQAFVTFHNEDLAIQALEEVNGTILSGRPIIAEFGRNTNRAQDGER